MIPRHDSKLSCGQSLDNRFIAHIDSFKENLVGINGVKCMDSLGLERFNRSPLRLKTLFRGKHSGGHQEDQACEKPWPPVIEPGDPGTSMTFVLS